VTTLGAWAGSALLYVGLCFGGGAAFFACWIGAEWSRARRGRAAAIMLGLGGAVALPLPGIVSLGSLIEEGAATALAFIALVLSAIAPSLPMVLGRVVAVAALVAAGAALATAGRSWEEEPWWLIRPAMLVHGMGIVLWVGALWPLLVRLRGGAATDPAALRRFSTVIPLAVLPLVAAGMLMGLLRLRDDTTIWTGVYALTMLGKAALLVPLLGLAAFNRVCLTEPAERGEPTAIARLRASVAAEIVLATAILLLVAMWRPALRTA